MEVLVAKQFTPIYDPIEDRLRLAININYPTRYDIFITRRFFKELLNSTKGLLSQASSSSSSGSSEEQKIYSFRKKPQLIENLNISYDKEKNVYNLSLRDKRVEITSSLTPQELANLLAFMLKQVQIEWDLY
jgi:hypothetical protein